MPMEQSILLEMIRVSDSVGEGGSGRQGAINLIDLQDGNTAIPPACHARAFTAIPALLLRDYVHNGREEGRTKGSDLKMF